MRRELRTASFPAGGHLIALLLSTVALGGLCAVNFALRWVDWCNVAVSPLSEAWMNTGFILVSAFFAALAVADMFRPQVLWTVPLVYGLFFLALPTSMFFSDYLIANMLVVFSMYHVMKCSGSAGSEKGHVFFASFFVVLAAWFVPSAVVFLLAVYMGIVLFSPSDVRALLIPLAGMAASYVLLLTYEIVFLGGSSFFPEMSLKVFAMPYTEKVFKADNFYFYAACLAFVLLWAYLGLGNAVRNDTVPRKKRFMALSAMSVSAALAVAVMPSGKYLVVFFSLPFAAVVARFFTIEGARVSKSIIRWFLAIVALGSLFFFK